MKILSNSKQSHVANVVKFDKKNLTSYLHRSFTAFDTKISQSTLRFPVSRRESRSRLLLEALQPKDRERRAKWPISTPLPLTTAVRSSREVDCIS